MNEMLHEQLSELCLRKRELGVVKTLVNSGFSIPVRGNTLGELQWYQKNY